MIENLPLRTRKAILFFSISMITLSVIFFKIYFFSEKTTESKDNEFNNSLRNFSQELEETLKDSKKQLQEAKEQFKELSSLVIPTSSEVIAEESTTTIGEIDLEKLKQELNSRLMKEISTSTPTSTNYEKEEQQN